MEILLFVNKMKVFQNITKHAYSNILENFTIKKENFQKKKSVIFHIYVQNIDCRYSLDPLRLNKKNMYTPVNPSFTI